MQVYKREAGMWARVPLTVVGGVVTVYAARTALGWAKGPASYVYGGIAFLLVACITLYLAFFHRKTGEVLIDTENEMRKVVWPTRQEVTGSTVVVIMTVLILALVIYGMDFGIGKLLTWVGLY